MVMFVTASPLGMYFVSGSLPRRPMISTLFNLAMLAFLA
jgi:hypothetical protein